MRARKGSEAGDGGLSIDAFATGEPADAEPEAAAPAAAYEEPAADGQAGEERPERPFRVPQMSPAHERIVERVFRVDVSKDYDELEVALKFDRPASEMTYGELVDALDAALDNARRAHRLFVGGKVALEVFELDAEILAGDMRAQATTRLQDEKTRGVRAKAITDGDVEAMMAAMFPDQYRATKEARAKAKRMVDHLERLADLWKIRCGALDTMVKGSRRL